MQFQCQVCDEFGHTHCDNSITNLKISKENITTLGDMYPGGVNQYMEMKDLFRKMDLYEYIQLNHSKYEVKFLSLKKYLLFGTVGHIEQLTSDNKNYKFCITEFVGADYKYAALFLRYLIEQDLKVHNIQRVKIRKSTINN